jgi:fluoride exporter
MTSLVSTSLLVALGGAAGAVLRFWTGRLAAAVLGAGWPWGTFIVNVAGAFAIGAVIALAGRDLISLAQKNFLTIGVLGGFTTFSAFSLEVVQLIQRDHWGTAILYILLSVTLSIFGVVIGMRIFA